MTNARLLKDTIDKISNAKRNDHKSKLELIKLDADSNLQNEIDTVELTDHRFACDCPNWFDSVSFIKSIKRPNDYNRLSNDKDDFYYYIEPADSSLIISICFEAHTTIRIIGRRYKKIGLPRLTKFQDPKPIPGKIFKYYSYQIVRPYQIFLNLKSVAKLNEGECDDSITTLLIH